MPKPRRELPGPSIDAEHAQRPVHPEHAARPTDTVDHPQDTGTAELTATAGDASAEKISTKAETKAEKAMAEVRGPLHHRCHLHWRREGCPDPEQHHGVTVAGALRAGRVRPRPADGEAPEPCSCE
ncbi:hypothetical protein ACIRVK_35075 [Streptomyces sp. NPDC101152]|uniref:hypothetical protein n=1 Tax=Streptomyces sp. NPDC101152 TaxID=3366116 RepID=UPI00382F6A4C